MNIIQRFGVSRLLPSVGAVRGLKRPSVNTSQLKEGRRTGALAMKVGMLGIWDAWGVRIPVTILHLDACEVVQVKTEESNGYTALQLGVGEAKASRVNITTAGHYQKAGVVPKRKLEEFRVTPDALLPVGTQIHALHFVAGQLVDVRGITKGKGFQGVMKKWNFKGGRASHGNSRNHRTLGSTGQCQDPGRVWKGKKMPGRMGGRNKTTQNLKVVKIDPSRNLLYVRGAVPGNNGSFIRISDAVKGPFFPNPPPFPTAQGSILEEITEEQFAPVSTEDTGNFKIPENQLA
mmetsp:Transcript_15682/g.26141  ORF Transcript_15682/g.26141 Transcript_15682/m.26141 type:complete len:290 (+) Transcript_15682:47-916(+)